MAEIDWSGFASDVRAALGDMPINAAVARWPGTNKTLWSRARRGLQPLSAENYLAVCRLLGLDPWRRYSDAAKPKRVRRSRPRSLRDIAKNLQNQTVSVTVSRGTAVRP